MLRASVKDLRHRDGAAITARPPLAVMANNGGGCVVQEKHSIKGLMQGLLTDIVKLQPKDPTQYLVDVMSFDDATDAVQDKHGLSAYRQRKLLEVFKGMDKVSGRRNPSHQKSSSEVPCSITLHLRRVHFSDEKGRES